MEYDFIIVGSGPAGSVISWNLASKGFKIAIIDRASKTGRSNKNSFIYSPYISNCPNFYSPLFSNQLGGNSALWNNKVYLISKDEFSKSNWHFSYDELVKFSSELAKKFNINHRDINFTTFKKNIGYSQSKRIKKLGNIFEYLDIKNNSNIDVFSHTSPIELSFKENSVVFVKVLNSKSGIEKILKVKKDLIFCAGGLGNPTIINNLINSENKNIGKYLCDHAHINLTEIKKAEYEKYAFFGKYFINKNEDLLEQNLYIERNNYFVGVNFDFLPDPARILKRIFIKTRQRTSKYILSKIIYFYSFFYKVIASILSKFNFKGKYSLEFFFSQAKNKFNYVKLSDKDFDEFRLKKSDINWGISKNEKEIYNELIDELVGKEGKLFNNNEKHFFNEKKIFVGLHPSCTTSIGKNISDGCVDSNLKLFNYKNIYVSGSSIFSNNGFTNPTWTIMTLSYRLSEYLNNK